MKISTSFLLAGFALFFIIPSCKKSSSNPNNSSGTGNLVRIQQGVDPNIGNDTVYLIKYNGSGQITSIIDSINQDTIAATYDGLGNLTAWGDTYGTTTTFSYNGTQLTEIDQELAGSHEQFVLTYTNNVLSQVNHNSDLGGGSLTPVGYFTVTMSGGNVSEQKVYTSGAVLQGILTFTYNSQANIFQKLSLFDVGGVLGSDDIFNPLTWFNKNLLVSASTGGPSATSTYTFNSSQQPTRIVTNDQINGALFTWQFSYK